MSSIIVLFDILYIFCDFTTNNEKWPACFRDMEVELEVILYFDISHALVAADPTVPFNGRLDFCGLGAQWSNGPRYTVTPRGIFCPMEQCRAELCYNITKGDLNPCAKEKWKAQ